jgi:hypothetical protein
MNATTQCGQHRGTMASVQHAALHHLPDWRRQPRFREPTLASQLPSGCIGDWLRLDAAGGRPAAKTPHHRAPARRPISAIQAAKATLFVRRQWHWNLDWPALL